MNLQRLRNFRGASLQLPVHQDPVEALKAVEQIISQSHAKTTASSAAQLERDTPQPVPQQETEETELGNVESLERALHHLDRLKTLVDDMNERKARAEDDGTDCTDTHRLGQNQ